MIAGAGAVEAYIAQIPPMRDTLRQCYLALGAGNLPLAARHAAADPALLYYLRQLTTRPLYGFPAAIKDPAQIFGVLGLGGSRSAVENFLFSQMLPEKFSVFNLSRPLFMAFQDEFLARWLRILKHLKADEMRYAALPPLLMGAIIVADALFAPHKETVIALRGVQGLDYDTLLQRFGGMGLFEVVAEIARRWELPEAAVKLLHTLAARRVETDLVADKLARWLHLLFFYTLSRPEMVAAGLNDFITFEPAYVETIMDEFMSVVSDATGD